MDKALYEKEVNCPLCRIQFTTLKVRWNSCIVDKRDEDFCVHYKTFNPMFYEIFVCPQCGYAASETFFNQLTKAQAKKLIDFYLSFKVERSFCMERSIKDAIDSYKLALYTYTSKQEKASIIAGTCLKIAWLYRIDKDNSELTYLKYALEKYREAYDVESLPIGNFDEITVQYLLGELSRRTNKLDDAIKWFDRATSHKQRFEKPRIEKMAREQWSLVRMQKRNFKNTETF